MKLYTNRYTYKYQEEFNNSQHLVKYYLYHQIIKTNLSVRASEKLIKKFIQHKRYIPPTIQEETKITTDEIIKSLKPYLKTKINIKWNDDSGILNIHFSSLKKLLEIVKKIRNE